MTTAAAPATTHIQYSIPLGSVLRASFAGGKVAVPVANYTLFAQFEHFTAIPAGADGQGYSISRLRALDALIDEMSAIAQQAGSDGADSMRRAVSQAAHSNPAQDVAELAPQSIDQLISDFGGKVQALLEHFDAIQFSVPVQATGTPGSVMNLTA